MGSPQRYWGYVIEGIRAGAPLWPYEFGTTRTEDSDAVSIQVILSRWLGITGQTPLLFIRRTESLVLECEVSPLAKQRPDAEPTMIDNGVNAYPGHAQDGQMPA